MLCPPTMINIDVNMVLPGQQRCDTAVVGGRVITTAMTQRWPSNGGVARYRREAK
jgi:hypothetical protein